MPISALLARWGGITTRPLCIATDVNLRVTRKACSRFPRNSRRGVRLATLLLLTLICFEAGGSMFVTMPNSADPFVLPGLTSLATELAWTSRSVLLMV